MPLYPDENFVPYLFPEQIKQQMEPYTRGPSGTQRITRDFSNMYVPYPTPPREASRQHPGPHIPLFEPLRHASRCSPGPHIPPTLFPDPWEIRPRPVERKSNSRASYNLDPVKQTSRSQEPYYLGPADPTSNPPEPYAVDPRATKRERASRHAPTQNPPKKIPRLFPEPSAPVFVISFYSSQDSNDAPTGMYDVYNSMEEARCTALWLMECEFLETYGVPWGQRGTLGGMRWRAMEHESPVGDVWALVWECGDDYQCVDVTARTPKDLREDVDMRYPRMVSDG